MAAYDYPLENQLEAMALFGRQKLNLIPLASSWFDPRYFSNSIVIFSRLLEYFPFLVNKISYAFQYSKNNYFVITIKPCMEGRKRMVVEVLILYNFL